MNSRLEVLGENIKSLVCFRIGESYEYLSLFWDIIALGWTNIIKCVSKIRFFLIIATLTSMMYALFI